MTGQTFVSGAAGAGGIVVAFGLSLVRLLLIPGWLYESWSLPFRCC